MNYNSQLGLMPVGIRHIVGRVLYLSTVGQSSFFHPLISDIDTFHELTLDVNVQSVLSFCEVFDRKGCL